MSIKQAVRNNIMIRYLRESREELTKVTWPTRQEANKYSMVVVLICVGLGAFFFLLDLIFNQGLNALINLAS